MPDTQTLTEPRAVEGSGGLLLEIDGQIVPNYDATIVDFDEGDVVSGRVVQIDQDEVLVDIGYKSEGVILLNELSIRKSVDPHDEVEMGEEVDALVLTKEDQDGRLLLSKKRARFEKAWRKIEAAAESGEPVEGNVIEVVKGGLIIDLGVRGFLPASLVDIRRVQNLDEFLGTKIECKVIELNRSRNNVVLSRRAVLEEERKEVRQQILDRLQPGMIVEGAISNIVDFGAFVDLDGIDGLIHISELSWSHVNHPSEILAIGDVVPVKVLDIDRDRQRISLGLKQTQEDPWQRVIDTYRVGDELEGKVTKVVTFGLMLLVCLARPELLETRAEWGTPQPNRSLLFLEALPDADARRLVESAGDEDLGSATASRIVGTAEGNPLFLEQLVAVGTDAGEALPSSIQAVLAARIDRLEPGERALLEDASVQGRSFYVGAVEELLPDHERGSSAPDLVLRVRKQLVRGTAPSWRARTRSGSRMRSFARPRTTGFPSSGAQSCTRGWPAGSKRGRTPVTGRSATTSPRRTAIGPSLAWWASASWSWRPGQPSGSGPQRARRSCAAIFTRRRTC